MRFQQKKKKKKGGGGVSRDQCVVGGTYASGGWKRLVMASRAIVYAWGRMLVMVKWGA